MIIYTDVLIPERFAGTTFCFVSLIRPAYKDDIGLLEHEKVHQKQFWHNPLMQIFYSCSPKYRLAYEVEAYKKQASMYIEDRIPLFATYIAKNYGLAITQEEAQVLLRE